MCLFLLTLAYSGATCADGRISVCSRFGRKRATQIPVVLMFIFSGVSGLCPNFYLYLASQFLVGIGYGGYRLNAVILGTFFVFLLELRSVKFDFSMIYVIKQNKTRKQQTTHYV